MVAKDIGVRSQHFTKHFVSIQNRKQTLYDSRSNHADAHQGDLLKLKDSLARVETHQDVLDSLKHW